MKTIIAGGRDYRFTERDYDYLDQRLSIGGISEVVCGGSTGADECGRQWAIANDVPVKLFPADWKKHGKAAGPIRNRQMAVYAHKLIAFWDGVSKGTKNMIDTAREEGCMVTVIRTDLASAPMSETKKDEVQ